MAERRVALVLLAAGRGRRFGSDKLAARIGGRTMLSIAMATAGEVEVASRFVVRPAGAATPAVAGWTVVEAPAASTGLATSIRCGIAAARDHSHVLVTLADMPFLTAGYLRSLAACDGVALTVHPDGRSGCPALFPASAFPTLAALEGDRGAGALPWPGAVRLSPTDPGILRDVDLPSDLPEERGRGATGTSSRVGVTRRGA